MRGRARCCIRAVARQSTPKWQEIGVWQSSFRLAMRIGFFGTSAITKSQVEGPTILPILTGSETPKIPIAKTPISCHVGAEKLA